MWSGFSTLLYKRDLPQTQIQQVHSLSLFTQMVQLLTVTVFFIPKSNLTATITLQNSFLLRYSFVRENKPGLSVEKKH